MKNLSTSQISTLQLLYHNYIHRILDWLNKVYHISPCPVKCDSSGGFIEYLTAENTKQQSRQKEEHITLYLCIETIISTELTE